MYEIVPRGLEGMISRHARDFERNLTCTLGILLNRVPGYPGTRSQILGEYEALVVPVTGISKPGNTRECPAGYLEKG